MNSQSNHPVEKFLFGIALGVILLLWFGLSGSPGAHAQEVGIQTPTDTAVVIDPTGTPTPTGTSQPSETIGMPTETPQPKGYFWVRPLGRANGTAIEEMVIHGPPIPPPGLLKKDRQVASLQLQGSVTAAGVGILSVPAYPWIYGCSAVSGAMIAAFYDRTGYPNIYTGPTDGGVMPMNSNSWSTWGDGVYTYRNNPLIASKNGVDGRTIRGSIDDYWVQYNSSASDPYITGGWTQHTWGDAIGDYMRTSQSHFNGSTTWGLGDAYTRFYDIYPTSATPLTCAAIESYTLPPHSYPPDGTLGRKQFYEARGYTVTDCYNQYTDNIVSGGFSFDQYKAEIDAGRPVMLNLSGHTIVGIGYDSSTNTVYLNDTWDTLTHSMTWGGSYAGMELQAVSIVNLAPTRPDLSITGLTVLPSAPLTNQDIQVTVDVANLTDVASTTFRTDLYIDGQWSQCWGVGQYFKRLTDLAGNTTYSWSVTIPAGTLSAGTHTISAYADSGCEADETSDGNNNAGPVSVVISVPPNSFTLSVSVAGTGSGTVTGTGISCPGDCSEPYAPNTSVTLTANPATGSTFTGWSGACTGTGTCTVSMTAAQTVTATFTLQTYTLTVGTSGAGSGTVTGTGISCPGDCSEIYNYGTSVTLTATPATGSTFAGWSGACTGTGACTVSMTAARSVTATFAIQTFTLSISVAGTGSGTVTGTGIVCPGDCSEIYNTGTPVTLTAVPSSGFSKFASWSGDAIGTDNPVQVTMSGDRSVTAQFTQATFSDVPYDFSETLGGVSYQLYPYIQAMYDNGFTNGCSLSQLSYCPTKTLNRAESAKFLLNVMHGAGYTAPVPPTNPVFQYDDWSPDPVGWARPWAEQLYVEGLTNGCNVSLLMYCPWMSMPREQAAKFGLTIKYGPSYIPPDATGTVFADMTDTTYWGTPWMEEAYLEGIIVACGTQDGKPMICPSELMDRAWTAYMIVKAKNLPLAP